VGRVHEPLSGGRDEAAARAVAPAPRAASAGRPSRPPCVEPKVRSSPPVVRSALVFPDATARATVGSLSLCGEGVARALAVVVAAASTGWSVPESSAASRMGCGARTGSRCPSPHWPLLLNPHEYASPFSESYVVSPPAHDGGEAGATGARHFHDTPRISRSRDAKPAPELPAVAGTPRPKLACGCGYHSVLSPARYRDGLTPLAD